MTDLSGSRPAPDTGERCGYAVIDSDGFEEPCDRPASGWRWYQNVEHEDALDVACSLHVNEGGRRLRADLDEIERLQGVVERLTGIQRNGDMPRYLDAHSRTVAAEAALDRVLALCDRWDDGREPNPDTVAGRVRAAIAGDPS